MKKKIRLAGVDHSSIVDGPGLRFVIFTQGCRHACRDCFNSETHSFHGGSDVDADDVIKQIKSMSIIKGVTFSGGDCFEQAEACAYVAKEVKGRGLDIWAYTGYTFEQILENIEQNPSWKEFLNEIDILVDGKFEIEKKDLTLCFRGSANQRLIDVKESLLCGTAVIYEL
ncbi:MAG: anaerobic ribonucleoside-triphosphate reductase activating protein [Oscillospiraceae bacterium]|nr:anaerobic ribonucleoside-triphosphate reductase activating protein [Oscillospiraceae bacterium]